MQLEMEQVEVSQLKLLMLVPKVPAVQSFWEQGQHKLELPVLCHCPQVHHNKQVVSLLLSVPVPPVLVGLSRFMLERVLVLLEVE